MKKILFLTTIFMSTCIHCYDVIKMPNGRFAGNLSVVGKYAYAPDGVGMTKINLKTGQTYLADYAVGNDVDEPVDIKIYGNLACISEDDSGFSILNLDDNTYKKFNEVDESFGVDISDGYAFVTDEDKGVYKIDIENKKIVDLIDLRGRGNLYLMGIDVVGTKIYLANGSYGIYEYDQRTKKFKMLYDKFDGRIYSIKYLSDGLFLVSQKGHKVILVDVREQKAKSFEFKNTPYEYTRFSVQNDKVYIGEGSQFTIVGLNYFKFENN